MHDGIPSRAAFTFKRLDDGERCDFSYEESCDDKELVRKAMQTFGPTLEILGLQASVSEDGRTLHIKGICDIRHAADMIVSEFLPISHASQISLGDIWKTMAAKHRLDFDDENGHDGKGGAELLSEIELSRLVGT